MTSRRARARRRQAAAVRSLGGRKARKVAVPAFPGTLYPLRPAPCHSLWAPPYGPRQPWQLLWRLPGLYPLVPSAQPVGAHEVRRQLRGRSGLRSARALAPRDPQLSLFPLWSRSGVDPAVRRSRRFCPVPSGGRVLAPGLRRPGPRWVRLVSLRLCGCVLSGGGCPGLGNPRAGLPRPGPGLQASAAQLGSPGGRVT